jgi:2-polyprenyl-6-methoxyphenol hydroxylase-like FAD-dependent oxidoreductase
MTRLLERWGMLADVRARGSVGTAMVFRDGARSLHQFSRPPRGSRAPGRRRHGRGRRCAEAHRRGDESLWRRVHRVPGARSLHSPPRRSRLTCARQHADLYEILSAHARTAGVEIRSGARVVEVDAAAPAVVLVSGERVAGDIIVGADGTTSVVRECLIKLAPQPSSELQHIYV